MTRGLGLRYSLALCLALSGGPATAQTREVFAGNLNFGDIWNKVTNPRSWLNPTSVLNPTGIPTTGDLIEAVATNPDQIVTIAKNPAYAAYEPIVAGIVAGRNAVLINGGRPIPSHVRAALRGYYSDSMMDSVRWSTNWNALQNVPQAIQMIRDPDTKAIALINAVVFRDSASADNTAIWAHELHHVKQYADWGVLEFAKRWTDNPSTNGEVESPAYVIEDQVRQAFEARSEPLERPVPDGGECAVVNLSTAFCDLYAANGPGYVRFTVNGVARATSNGENKGSMSLVMITNGNRCNAKADVTAGVDNATQLEGDGYSCNVTLPAGHMQRVYLVAPNNIADAAFTKGTVSWTRVQCASRPSRGLPC